MKWVNVKRGLPNGSQDVATFNDKTGNMSVIKKSELWAFDYWRDEFHPFGPSHWIPLPKPSTRKSKRAK